MNSVFLFLLTVFLVDTAFSQDSREGFQPKMKLGFLFGTNISHLNMETGQLSPYANNTWDGNDYGAFRLGIFSDIPMDPRLSLSPAIELSSYPAHISYGITSIQITAGVLPVIIELNAHMRYILKGEKWHPYILAGPDIRLPLYSIKKYRVPSVYNPDFALDIGVGIQKKTSRLTFAPEIRYSFSFADPGGTSDKVTYNYFALLLKFW